MDEALENRKVFMDLSMNAVRIRRESLALGDASGVAEEKGGEAAFSGAMAEKMNRDSKGDVAGTKSGAGNPLDALSPASLAKLLMNADEFARLFKEADVSGDGILQKDEVS